MSLNGCSIGRNGAESESRSRNKPQYVPAVQARRRPNAFVAPVMFSFCEEAEKENSVRKPRKRKLRWNLRSLKAPTSRPIFLFLFIVLFLAPKSRLHTRPTPAFSQYPSVKVAGIDAEHSRCDQPGLTRSVDALGLGRLGGDSSSATSHPTHTVVRFGCSPTVGLRSGSLPSAHD